MPLNDPLGIELNAAAAVIVAANADGPEHPLKPTRLLLYSAAVAFQLRPS